MNATHLRCIYCGKVFPRRQFLRYHLERLHGVPRLSAFAIVRAFVNMNTKVLVKE